MTTKNGTPITPGDVNGDPPVELELPGMEPLTVGPGTVPTSESSADTTNIEEVVDDLEAAADLGVFEKELENGTAEQIPGS